MQQLKSLRYWLYCFFFSALAMLFFPMPYSTIAGVVIAQILYGDNE
ncbi:hypothetical protein L2Z53_09860 [Macrococcoides canis]|nr:hypothetical protein [Macrococcus canis]UJS27433.1 hypothetical protein L2Z53_09860 [Macrococcus canis]